MLDSVNRESHHVYANLTAITWNGSFPLKVAGLGKLRTVTKIRTNNQKFGQNGKGSA